MLFSIDEADHRPIYQQICDEVRRALIVGTLASEDPLPSVRQLAAELQVNPNTVQQAYRELERDGVVYVRRGQGTFVAEGAISNTARERKTQARMIAQRALREAYRNGLAAEDLIEAIRGADGAGAKHTTKGARP